MARRSKQPPGRPRRADLVYKIRWARYVDAAGRRCKKSDPGAVKTHEESECYYGDYPIEGGQWRRLKLTTDKEASTETLSAKRKEQRALLAGNRTLVERRRPLVEHLADFRRYLEKKQRTREHTQGTASRVQEMLEECHFFRIDDVNASIFQHWLADKRCRKGGPPRRRPKPKNAPPEKPRPPLSAKTRNYYLRDCKAFFKWLVHDRRITESDNRLAYLEGWSEHDDEPRERRALSDRELARLLRATEESNKTFCDQRGADRAMIYVLAISTGFRAGELASLTPSRFEFAPAGSGRLSVVRLKAKSSKRRKADDQPLRADVAERMQRYLAERGCAPDEPIWDPRWANVGAEMLQVDLAAAGIAYRDEDGRYFDFHALRGQFCTMLADAGVHPARAQKLARHSDINLTLKRYTRPALVDLAAEVEKLPDLFGPAPDDAAQQATGTHGRIDRLPSRPAPRAARSERNGERQGPMLAKVSSESAARLGNDMATKLPSSGGSARPSAHGAPRTSDAGESTASLCHASASLANVRHDDESDSPAPKPSYDTAPNCKSATVGSTPTSASFYFRRAGSMPNQQSAEAT